MVAPGGLAPRPLSRTESAKRRKNGARSTPRAVRVWYSARPSARSTRPALSRPVRDAATPRTSSAYNRTPSVGCVSAVSRVESELRERAIGAIRAEVAADARDELRCAEPGRPHVHRHLDHHAHRGAFKAAGREPGRHHHLFYGLYQAGIGRRQDFQGRRLRFRPDRARKTDDGGVPALDRKSTRLNSSTITSRMPSS